MIKIIFSLILINLSIYAEDINKAYELYKNNEYNKALNILLSFEKRNLIDDELYYNIGNCYYRINKPGLAIYYYEKALLENKLNNYAVENILFIKKQLPNQITPLPSFFAYYIVDNINKYISINFLSILTVILLLLLLFFIFLILYQKNDGKRVKYYKITTIFLSFALFATILILFTSYYYNIVLTKGIIINNTTIYTSPSESSKSEKLLGEGNKFIVEDNVSNFLKVRLEDGSIGWIKKDVQKQLNYKL